MKKSCWLIQAFSLACTVKGYAMRECRGHVCRGRREGRWGQDCSDLETGRAHREETQVEADRVPGRRQQKGVRCGPESMSEGPSSRHLGSRPRHCPPSGSGDRVQCCRDSLDFSELRAMRKDSRAHPRLESLWLDSGSQGGVTSRTFSPQEAQGSVNANHWEGPGVSGARPAHRLRDVLSPPPCLLPQSPGLCHTAVG